MSTFFFVISLISGLYLLGDVIRQRKEVNDSLKLLEGGVANLSDNLKDVTIRKGIEQLNLIFFRVTIYCLALIYMLGAILWLIGSEWAESLRFFVRPLFLITGYMMIGALSLWGAVKSMNERRIEIQRSIFFFCCITFGVFFLLYFGDSLAYEVFWSGIEPQLPSTKSFFGVNLFGVAWGRAGVVSVITAVSLLIYYMFYWFFNSFLFLIVVMMVAIPVFIARFLSENFPARETRLQGVAILLLICSQIGLHMLP